MLHERAGSQHHMWVAHVSLHSVVAMIGTADLAGCHKLKHLLLLLFRQAVASFHVVQQLACWKWPQELYTICNHCSLCPDSFLVLPAFWQTS